jgi:hypothetical protein
MYVCLCKLCLRDRQIALVRNYGNETAKRQLIDDLHAELENVEFDNSYWAAIRDGSWPGARQIAQDIIRRCDAIDKRKTENGAGGQT